MKKVRASFILFSFLFITLLSATAQNKKPRFRAIALAETGGGHAAFDSAAKIWLGKLSADSNIVIDYITDTKPITKDFLKQYQLFIQLDYPPYPWGPEAQEAFVDYIENGRGGWMGFHHPTLLGVFDGYPMWEWFHQFMGNITFKKHIPGGTTALLKVEDWRHPAMKGLPDTFTTKDEWYIYDQSPRPNVHVLASINEGTYVPDKDVKMGDHPVIWTNEKVKARNIYIAMGHFPELFQDEFYTALLRNAIFWVEKKGQLELSHLPIPMHKKIVSYDSVVAQDHKTTKDELLKLARKWVLKAFPNQEDPINPIPQVSGSACGKGIFKVKTNATGNYYWLQFKINITPTDSGYRYIFNDFYEEPIEKGITNEYSKIEYRWRDFKNGKPWSADDKPLFEGLDSNMRKYINDLKNAMSGTANNSTPEFKVLALYTTTVEDDHVDFANDAIKYFAEMGIRKNFSFDTTTDWSNLNDDNLKKYQVVIWLNDFPQNNLQRAAFEKYINNGGAWLGTHVAGYNDKYTKWRWYVDFLGGAVFHNNNWPPLPAKLIVDDNQHGVTKGLPKTFTAPINEWYGWKPNPRLNKNVKVLVTLDPSNYPLGKKDIIRDGDIPVVWTNTKYKMLYVNMGHGDHIFTTELQNKLFENAIMWLGKK